MRIRTIKPEFWESETIASLTVHARLLFVACLNAADDEGRLRWNAAYLKSVAFIYDEEFTESFIESLMEQITEASLIRSYQGGNRVATYAVIDSFSEHQRINRPSPSKLPEPPDFRPQTPEVTEGECSTNSLNRSLNDSVNDSLLERKGKEQGKERKGEGSARAQESPSAEESPGNHIPELPDVMSQVGSVAYPLTKECAEAFYDAREAEGWLTPKGNPIANWRASLKSFSRIWKQNEDREKVRNKGKPEPVTKHVPTKTEPQLKL